MARLLKLPEVAQRLEVSEKTARRYVKAGVLPSVFIGNAYRVNEEDVEEYLRRAKVEVGGDTPKAQALLPLELEEQRGAGSLSAGPETLYNPYEALGRVLASNWKDELDKWEKKIPEGESPSLVDFGRLLEWMLGIADTKHVYEAIAKDSYLHPQRVALLDTLRLMEEVDRAAMQLFTRVYEPAKTYSEFQKIVKETTWSSEGNNLEAILLSNAENDD